MEKTWFYSTKPSQNDWWQCQQREKWEYQNKLFSSMTALVLTTTTFTLERKKIFGSFFTATNELLLGLVDEKLTSFQYPLAFFASIPHYRSTPLREVSISMGKPNTATWSASLRALKWAPTWYVSAEVRNPFYGQPLDQVWMWYESWKVSWDISSGGSF